MKKPISDQSLSDQSLVKQKHNSITALLFLSPTLILFLLIFLFPICFIIWASMFRWNLLKPTAGMTFVGLGNFSDLLQDSSFWNAIWVTAQFVIITVPLGIIIGLLIALLLNRDFFGKRIIQSLILIPVMSAPVASYYSWKFMLEPTYGVVNFLLGLIHIKGLGWFSDIHTALISVIIVDLWLTIPFIFLVLYAGLQVIPIEPVESAQVDGANKLQIFRHITLPFLKPVLLIMTIVRIMDAIRVFDNIYVLTRGGPADVTRTIQFECYHLSFDSFLVGKGSALALIIVVIILIFGSLLIREMHKVNAEL